MRYEVVIHLNKERKRRRSEEREVGIRKPKVWSFETVYRRERVRFGLMDNINVIYMHIDLGFIVDIIKTIKIEFYGRDKVVNHFPFNSILTLKENFSKSTLKL